MGQETVITPFHKARDIKMPLRMKGIMKSPLIMSVCILFCTVMPTSAFRVYGFKKLTIIKAFAQFFIE